MNLTGRESPALLPDDARRLNRPFLNLVAECRVDGHAARAARRHQRDRARAGCGAHARWSPRPIDVDILLGVASKSSPARADRTRRYQRAFVLSPLIALDLRLTIPGRGERTVLEWSRDSNVRSRCGWAS
jgi:7,8-dihydro-6-hydroxymethylpterin-pyrophosphokinase